MRKAEDELDAFGGMLQRLDGMRKTDFFWRLPQADIRWDFSGKHECRLSDVKCSILGHGLDGSFLFGPVNHTTI